MIWLCPNCQGSLRSLANTVRCDRCRAEFPRVGNIPDLRISDESWKDRGADLERAHSLHARSATLSLEDMVRDVFANQPGRDQAMIDLRTRQVLGGTSKYQADLNGWLADGLAQAGTILDLGCGAGTLTSAVAPHADTVLGIDVSMEWLVVAERFILEHGGEPVLAAAMGERMPLPSGIVDFVVSLDVIEHVHDPDRYLSEINRVLRPGGRVALATPNRFSLTAEPHVSVWGVGWIPRRWQKQYVKAMSAKSYDNTCLLSYRDISNLLQRNTRINARIMPGTVPATEIARFPPLRARLARFYNRIQEWPVVRWLFRAVCPFFQISGTKQPG